MNRWRDMAGALALAAVLGVSGCEQGAAKQPAGKDGQPAAGQQAEAPKAPKPTGRPGDMLAADFAPELRRGVTVVFYAKVGCKACAQMEPVYEEALKRLPSGVNNKVMYPYMIDLDYYHVDELPTLVIYRDGREEKRFVGVTPGQKIVSAVQSAL